MERRTGEAFELDMRLTVVGRKLAVGERAPDFALDHLPPGGSAIAAVRLADTAGKVRLLNVVNSLDTPVCQVETCRWEKTRAAFPPGVEVFTVSMDLPFAAQRWQQAESVAHRCLSSHRSEDFGRAYGVLLEEWRLLQRAVFVIGGDGRLVHVEYVADQMREPDYDAAIAAASAAAATGARR